MLLTIGRHTVNIDRVLSIYDAGDKYILRFGHGEHSNQHHEVQFIGDDRNVFAQWLKVEATNLTPATPEDQEWEEYKAAGGDMPRQEWERTRTRHREISQRLDSLDPTSEGWKRQMTLACELEGRLLY